MPCPVCGEPSAPNAPRNDQRCGPCHNFKVVGFEGPFAVVLRLDFENWIDGLAAKLHADGNLRTFRPWLQNLRHVHHQRVEAWVASDGAKVKP